MDDAAISLIYTVSYLNVPLGRVHYRLQKTAQQWQVSSRTEPNLLASISSRSQREETTLFRWDQSRLKPQEIVITDFHHPDKKILVDWPRQKILFPNQRTSPIPEGPLYTTTALVYGIAFNPPQALKPGARLTILSEKLIEIYIVEKLTKTTLQVKAGKFSCIQIRAKRLGVTGDRIDLWLTTDTTPMIVQLDKYRRNKRTRFRLEKYQNWPPAQPLTQASP